MVVTIRRAGADDALWMQNSFDTQMGWTKRSGYFAECCQKQTMGELVLLVAHEAEVYMGHVKVIWHPNYAHFRDNNIPEIQDLNVLPQFRRQGIATQLVEAAEAIASERSPTVGIGFGLYAGYGPAQRMYILRGYVPDGRGVMVDGEPAQPGSTVQMDDDLVLYLTRRLR